ncbi:ATP-binding cassette domain-containing protein [Cellulosilyticum sp. ST5]|uniref:ABC transporter ATP-binding protein n=1 Tax=Cellulosilyticum sp. ST5 TaxID=3055805 RepID=UPI003977D42F
MGAFVEVNKLVKMYGDFCAVDHLSISIEEGEIFGLLGPNGAGKSTTLSAITTLNNFEKGSIKVGGFDIVKDKMKVKALVGMVPQDIAVYKHLNALENVKFFASFYGLKGKALEEAALEALEFVGLSEKLKMKPRQMSGGMQRRLNIACGIAHRPKLIVMDEPTVGVDAQSREHILNSIRILKQRGTTVIYTSHYMQEVEEICDHIAIVDHGKLIANGTKEELVSLVTDIKGCSITTRITSKVDTEQLKKELSVLPGVVRVNLDENEIHLDLSIKCENIMPILEIINAYKLPIMNVTSEKPNLDMTFLSLTGRELR